eukprot:TRINITY_DN15663_c0_g1_i1.p1 TRINITY_DN15663_c0_g1~~TRINITY_DN15663_c0_g1_i1.p1  ORF type:complete len:324 (-),score=54.64 TRINITY_DN15663_c0_g1_i1:27-998(-)
MRPLALKGHERAITCLKYNYDGDLLFTSAKDGWVCAWHTHNGERLGTYDGHKGAIWSVDVTANSKRLLTGAADRTARLWDVETGRELFQWEHNTTVRSVGLAGGDERFAAVTDAEMKLAPTICIYELKRDLSEQSSKPLRIIGDQPSRVNIVVWGPDNDHVITCSDDGMLSVYDAESGKKTQSVQAHDRAVNKIQLSYDKSMLLSASTDYTAKLWDARSMKVIKTYKAEQPINSASISPIAEHVILGGGQDAQGVTTTAAQQGKFDIHFYHSIYEEEIGTLKGHFGPIHTLAFAPDGSGFASGSEDGFVRLHHFDASYFAQKL